MLVVDDVAPATDQHFTKAGFPLFQRNRPEVFAVKLQLGEDMAKDRALARSAWQFRSLKLALFYLVGVEPKSLGESFGKTEC
jgi:hypothetical protein